MTGIHPELRKAAIVVMSLPPGEAAQMLAELEPAQAALLRQAMERCGGPSTGELQAVTRELSELEHAQATAAPFEYLHAIDGERLLPFLAGERPSVVSLVVAYLPPWKAARVTADLPYELQSQLTTLPDVRAIDPEIVADVADELRLQLSPLLDEHRLAHPVARERPRAASNRAKAG
ncbi:MAG: hypothetical protein DWQ37_23035 [Planctomycetota bacterium]|mgnify:CR=1 FL=1|nr:MAG: hypothetical protein DWQ37_23035 [Planctomycetota bacterium]